MEESSSISGTQYRVQNIDIKENNENKSKTPFLLFLFVCFGDFFNAIFDRKKFSYIEIGSLCYWGQKSLKAGSSLLVLSVTLPAQVRTPTFGTSLFSPFVNLIQGDGIHTTCNTDIFLLLELHGLQPECWELLLALINFTSWGRRKQCGKLRH